MESNIISLTNKILIAIICLTSILFSQNNLYNVNKIEDYKITIDGLLTETEWNNAKKTEGFVLLANGESSDLTIWAKMLWDNNNFYLAFYSTDPDLYSDFGNYQDDHIYQRDDLFEAFIDFNGDGYNYLEIGLSPKNINYDFIVIDPDYDNWQDSTEWDIHNIETATSYKGTIGNHYDIDTCWFAEIKIPFSSLDYIDFDFTTTVNEDDEWRLNLYRIDYDVNTPEWEPNNEYAWCSTGDSNAHLPNKFGKIIFKDNLIPIEQFIKQPVKNSKIKCVRYFTLNGKEIPSNLIENKYFSNNCYIVQYEYFNSKTVNKKIRLF